MYLPHSLSNCLDLVSLSFSGELDGGDQLFFFPLDLLLLDFNLFPSFNNLWNKSLKTFSAWLYEKVCRLYEYDFTFQSSLNNLNILHIQISIMIERFLKPKSQTYLNLNFLISYSLLDFCRLELISQLCFCFLKKKNLWRNFILQKELTAVFTSLSKFAFWSLNPLLLSSILVSKIFFISFYLISSG